MLLITMLRSTQVFAWKQPRGAAMGKSSVLHSQHSLIRCLEDLEDVLSTHANHFWSISICKFCRAQKVIDFEKMNINKQMNE